MVTLRVFNFFPLVNRNDLWNDNYTLDVPSSSCTTTYVTTITTESSNCNCVHYSIATVICGVAVPLVIIILALIAYIVYLRNKKLSDYGSIPVTLITVEQPLLE